MIPIYIPTLGRERIVTLEQFPPELLHRTILVTNRASVDKFQKLYAKSGVLVFACPAQAEPGEKPDGYKKGISPVRQWIFEKATPNIHLYMVDDDFTFYHRPDPADWHLQQCGPAEMLAMFRKMDTLLRYRTYDAVGISMRQGNNRMSGGVEKSKRLNGVWGVNRMALMTTGCKFTDVPAMQDFWFQMHLLTNGYQTGLLTNYAYNQPHTQAAGGCSSYRTEKLQAESVAKLVEKFPEFIRVRKVTTKGGWFDGQPRTDITFLGKKAYESSIL